MMDWNFERYRTRDRLLDYDFNIVPPAPHSAGLSMVYPWENIILEQLGAQIFLLAQQHGFSGTEEQFWDRFNNPSIYFGTLETFPVPGNENILYFDKENETLYYFVAASGNIDPNLIEQAGGEIVGESQTNDITYLYLPIRALLIEDTILNCGDAAEYID